MAVVGSPDGSDTSILSVPCAICDNKEPLHDMTVGMRYSNGGQAFACNNHFGPGEHYILGWVDFLATERERNYTASAKASSVKLSIPSYYCEQRSIKSGTNVSADIARHLYSRILPGTVVIISDQPHGLLSATRKQWYRLIRRVMRERASTLNASRILELNHIELGMQRLRFTLRQVLEESDETVLFINPEQTEHLPHNCHTVYVACVLEEQILNILKEHLQPNSLLVDYKFMVSTNEIQD